MIQRIAIIGVGGVGGYFGGKLCQLRNSEPDLDITFIARGEHLQSIQNSGLLLSSEAGELLCKPTRATDDFSELPELDLCLLCVKQFDLEAALQNLSSKIGPQTIVLPLLNGVDIQQRIRNVLTSGIVLPACVYVGTHIERPGKVTQKGGACRILFGPDPQSPNFSPVDLRDLFARASIKNEWTLQVQEEIWRKFIFICAFGLVSAAHNRTVGQILENNALKTQTENVMREVIAVSAACGIPLPEEALPSAMEKARGFPYETKTSFQRDFEQIDKPDERDLFAGTILRLAARYQISAPTVQMLSEQLEARKPAGLFSV